MSQLFASPTEMLHTTILILYIALLGSGVVLYELRDTIC